MLTVDTASIKDLERLQSQLLSAKMAVTGEGMEGLVNLALIQLQRFVMGNIEVDTARTKASIFIMNPQTLGKDVVGGLASQVSYSPFVRDAGHKEHFFEYAKRVEGPAVLEMLGREFTLAMKRSFDG